MNPSISFILGAGFSAPMGYPTGNKLNELLLNCTGENFAFHTSGVLCVSADGKKPNWGYKTSYDFQFDFCKDLIQYFNKKKGYFYYEEFYDFFNYEAEKDKEVEILLNEKNYGGEKDLHQMLFSLKNIYAQLVSHYLVDGKGKAWYDNEPYKMGFIDGYTGILRTIKELSKKYVINFHSLNHDLFFESLNSTDWLEGNLCDGFEETGSPYYGKLLVEGREYKCRLQHYSGKYDKQLRLYKLHGSKDYGIYFSKKGGGMFPENYLKTRWGIGFDDFYKEIRNDKGELVYENCWVNYHADFLTGTTSKLQRYNEPLLYKILHEHFANNMKEAERLVIVGYGGKDLGINEMIFCNYDYKNKPVTIIDPFPGNELIGLKEKLNAKLITKHLQDISLSDL